MCVVLGSGLAIYLHDSLNSSGEGGGDSCPPTKMPGLFAQS